MEINDRMLQDYFRYGAFLLLGIGVGVQNSVFYNLGIGLSLAAIYIDREFLIDKKNNKFYWSIILFLGYAVLCSIIAFFQENYMEAKSALRMYKFLIPVLVMFIFFYKPRNYFKWSVIGFLIALFYNNVFVFNQYIDGIADFMTRYRGRFWTPNALGSFVQIAIPIVLYYCYYFRKSWMHIFIGVLSVIASLFSLYLSASRGATMAVIVEVLILVVIVWTKKYNKFNKNTLYRIVLFCAITSAICVFLYSKIFTRSYDGERILLWTSAWKIFLDHPLIGVGLSDWNSVYVSQYISELAKERSLQHPHNAFLYILSGMGVLGFIPFFFMIILQIKTAIKYSYLDFTETRNCFSIMDMMLIVIAGMIVHNLVDVTIIFRYYLTIYLFFWGLCCYRMGELDDIEKYY